MSIASDFTWPDLRDAKIIAIDTETSDPNLLTMGPGGFRNDGFLLGVSFCTDTGLSGYLPIGHQDGENLDKAEVVSYLNTMLGTDIPKVGANISYDLEWLNVTGINVRGTIRDIQIAEPLLDEERPGGYSLDTLAKDYLGVGKDEVLLRVAAEKYGCKYKTEKEIKGFLKLFAPEYVAPYAVEDARLTLEVYKKQIPKLREEELWSIFELESKLTPIFMEMKKFGVRMDMEKIQPLSEEMQKRENRIQKEIKRVSGLEIDCWSGPSIQKYFDQEGMKYKKTKKGAASFEGEFLTDHEDPVCKLIAEWRKVNTMRVRYVEDIPKYAVNGRIHACVHQIASDDYGTKSGRLSYSHLNLQKIPKRDAEWRPVIRGLFLPEEGCFWGQQDYSQQEPRLGVHYASLRNMPGAAKAVEYYKQPKACFHTIVAEMAGIERPDGKTLNLGSWYGMGKDKMMKKLKKPRAESEDIYNKYHEALPFVKGLLKDAARAAEHRGYVKTILGRRGHFNLFTPRMTWDEKQEQNGKGYYYKPLHMDKIPAHIEELKNELAKVEDNTEETERLETEINKWSSGRYERSNTYRALNRIIQGSAADQTKKSILDIYEHFGHVRHIQFQVHDELDGSYDNMDQIQTVRSIMENAVQLVVPVVVEPEIGPSWGQCKKVE